MISFNNVNKLLISFGIVIVFLSSCTPKYSGSDTSKAPIKENKFVKIMVDVRLAESIIRRQSSIGNNPEIVTKQLYSSIFKKYGITNEEFKESMKIYAKNPEKMYEINERVVENLSQLESEVKTQKTKTKVHK